MLTVHGMGLCDVDRLILGAQTNTTAAAVCLKDGGRQFMCSLF